METLWSAVYDWASSADIAAFFASALASAACALAVLAADLALCVALSFAVRRFAAKRNGSRHLKDRIVSFIHAGIWTVFVWGLYAWLPDAFPTSPQLARIVARVLNVATGRETSALEMARTVAGLVGATKAIEVRGRPHPGDPARWCADISRLQSLLPDWQPEALDTGLERCVTAWQRAAA
jgi:hypothetical protein